MGGWHREHPELVGTDADPWMAHPIHRQATEELRRMGLIWLERDEDEEDPDGS